MTRDAHVQPLGATMTHGMPEGFYQQTKVVQFATMTIIGWAADGSYYARYEQRS